MKTIVTTKTLYRFDELSESAKQAACQWYAEGMPSDWYADVCDDFEMCVGFMGLTNVRTQFSGFWSQGDGASFLARYAYRKNGLIDLIAYAPTDTALHEIARDIVAIQRRAFYRIDGAVTLSGRYCHEYTMRFDNDDLLECFRRLARWFYAALEKSYEYLTSPEHVAEMCEANEWHFDEKGKFYAG